MNVKTYTPSELNAFMASMRNIYSIVRLVDPEECRVLTVDDDGTLHFEDQCFAIWNACQRCADCVSFRASHSQKTLSKIKACNHHNFHITSTPVRIRTEQRTIFCSLELGTEELPANAPAVVPVSDSNSADYLLTHDVLTQLLNTEGFYREVRRKLVEDPGGDYVILAGNIQRFKVLNSLYGRAYGDSVLIDLADFIKTQGGEGALYARDMADGLLVFDRKDQFSMDHLLDGLAKIRERFSTKDFLFSMHVGIYEITDRSLPVSTMVNHACLAMRSIRTSSVRGVAYFSDEMMKNELREHMVVSTFDQVLEEGRFHMYLQPQVDRDGNLIGAEALVRAKEKDGGLTAPAFFIGVLEKSEQISRLDRYILEQAVSKLAEWDRSGSPLLQSVYISINVSPKDLYAMSVPETILAVCRKYGVDPSRLHVEITETSIMDDLNNRTDNIARLKDMGFTVEIDDFGKGASSLALLGRSNADVLKIDKEFLRGIQKSEKAYQILKSVISLTKEIGMTTIIEGVETEEQLRVLEEMGCSIFQGFYFAKPMPPEELERKYACIPEQTGPAEEAGEGKPVSRS